MNLHINFLVNTIIKMYFTDIFCLLIITDDTKQPVDYVGDLPKVNLEFRNNLLNREDFLHHFGCFGIVIKSTNPNHVIKQAEKAIRNTTERFNLRKYLIVPDNITDNVMSVFELKEVEYIDDLLVIKPSINETVRNNTKRKLNTGKDEMIKYIRNDMDMNFEFVTNKFVGVDGHKVPIILDKWFSKNGSFLFGNNLYPDKISDQRGRAITGATITYPPYSVPALMDGIEIRLMSMYADIHNMTVKLLVDEEAQWGEINDDWTGYGIVGNVAMDLADIGFAAIYHWEREFMFLDMTKTFITAGVTCLVPAPTLANGWLTPITVFNGKIWIFVGLSFISAALTFLLFSAVASGLKMHRRRFRRPFFGTVAIFLDQSVSESQLIVNSTFRYIFGLVILFCVLMTSFYRSELATSMTIPRFEGVIDTVQNLIDSNIEWGSTDIAWTNSIRSDTSVKIVTLMSRFRVHGPEKLKELAYSGRFGYILERLPGGHYAIVDYIGENEIPHLRPMKEDLYYGHVVFILKKSSVLTSTMNGLIRKFVEAGLLIKWETEIVMKTLDAKVQKAVLHQQYNTERTKLKMVHLAGVFAMWTMGLTLAVVTFIAEILYVKHERRNPDDDDDNDDEDQ